MKREGKKATSQKREERKIHKTSGYAWQLHELFTKVVMTEAFMGHVRSLTNSSETR